MVRCASAGNDDELADWAAFQTATASAWKRGWAKGTLKEWGHDLLQKVLFKVSDPQSCLQPCADPKMVWLIWVDVWQDTAGCEASSH